MVATSDSGAAPTVEPVFIGVGVALLTLFDEDGMLAAAGSAELADRLVAAGVAAVVVAGSTGEAASLSREERRTLLAAVRAAVGERVPVIAGTGAPTTGEAVDLTVDAVEGGADAVLTLSPPGIDDPSAYYAAVADVAGGLPLLAYHFPTMSAPGIAVTTLPSLPVDGLKDSSGEPDRLLEELEVFDRPLYTGSASILSFAGPLGCAGAILALANVEPETCARAFAGDAEAQRSLTPAILEAREEFPRGLKRMAARRWGTGVRARLG